MVGVIYVYVDTVFGYLLLLLFVVVVVVVVVNCVVGCFSMLVLDTCYLELASYN